MRCTKALILFGMLAASISACGKSASSPASAASTTGGTTQTDPVGGTGDDAAISVQLSGNAQTLDPNGTLYGLVSGSGTGGGTATATGTVKGVALTPTTAVFDMVGDASGNPLYAWLVIGSDPNFCTDLTQNANEIASSVHATMQLASINSDGQSLPLSGNATYTVTTSDTVNNLASMVLLPYDAKCQLSVAAAYLEAAAGTVTLTALDPNQAVGSFSLQVGSQADALSGTFHAAPCAGLAAAELGRTGDVGCQ